MMRLLVAFTIFIAPLLSVAQLTDFTRQELSYKNELAPLNAGFESGTAKWTASGGTFASVTSGSNLLEGKGSTTWNSNGAAQTLVSQAVTVRNGLFGRNCEASIVTQVPSGTATHTLQAWNGTNALAFAAIESSTLPRRNTLTFPCPTSGTFAIRILSVAADEPLIALDEAYLGLARNIGSTDLITEWQAWTPTGGWTGSVTYTGRKRRVGDQGEYNIKVTTGGAPTGSSLTINMPSGETIDTSKMASAVASSNVVFGTGSVLDSGTRVYTAGVIYDTTTSVRIQAMGQSATNIDYGGVTPTSPMTFASGDTVDVFFTVPIVGWAASTTATIDAMTKRGSIYFASGSATNTGAVAAFNVAGFGTNTLEGQALAPTTANDLGIRLASAPAATYEVQATGLFYASSAATTGTRTVCQYSLYDGTNSRGQAYALTPGGLAAESNDGIGSLTGQFVLSSAGTINVVVRGQRVTGNGTCYAEGPVSISIKNVSQQNPAVILQNSMSSASLNGTYFNSAQVGSTGTVTKETGDWISGSCSVSTAVATCTLVAGAFSTDPACHATIFGETTSYNAVVTSATTSTVVVRTFDTANAAAAAAFSLTCSSPR